MWFSDFPYTQHSLPGGTQTIPIVFTGSLVVLRLSLYSSQSPGGTKIILFLITVSLVVQHLSLYSSQSPSCGSDYPYTHRSLPCVTLKDSIQITVSLVIVIIPLYSSQPPWWYSDYPYTHHSLPKGTQTIHYSSQYPRW